MKNIKLIIFDLDGTLVDAYPAIIDSFNYTLQKLGYSRKDDLTIRRAVGWGDENLLKPFIEKKDLKKALLMYRRHHKKSLLKYACLFPKAESILRYLKSKGYKLAVASNLPTRFSYILIRHLKLVKYFDYVLCADKLKQGKPHPEIINRIMRRLLALPQESVYIGDMGIDAQAGRRAKIKTIIVTTGSSAEKEIFREKPYRVIKRIRELLDII